jgi:hypothetical protein
MATAVMKFAGFLCLLIWLLSFAYADEKRREATTETVVCHWIDELVERLNEQCGVEPLRASAPASAVWRRAEATAIEAPFTR